MQTTIKYLVLFLFILSSCTKEVEQPRFDAKVVVNETMPFSAALQLQSSGNRNISVQLFYKEEQLPVLNFSKAIHDGEDKIVLPGLKSATSYYYSISGDNTILSEGNFQTKACPDWMSEFSTVKITGNCNLNGKLLLLNKMSMPSGIFAVNENGKTIWARQSPNFVKMVKLTHRGTILTLEDSNESEYGDANILLETTFSGDTLTWLRYGNGGFDRMAHHDAELLQNGNYAIITNVHTKGVVVDGITMLSPQGEKVWEWDMANHVLPVVAGQEFHQPWANSITIAGDGDFVVSFRNLSQVWKIEPFSGKVKWKIGRNGTIALHGDNAFMLQHHAQLNGDNLLLFDNGDNNNRPFSRVVEYEIDEKNNSAILQKAIVIPSHLSSPYMGAVQKQGNTFVITSSVNGSIAQINKKDIVGFTMEFKDRIFRAQLINYPFN